MVYRRIQERYIHIGTVYPYCTNIGRVLPPQPTTSDHINIKYIWGPHVNHMGTPREYLFLQYINMIMIKHKKKVKTRSFNINLMILYSRIYQRHMSFAFCKGLTHPY